MAGLKIIQADTGSRRALTQASGSGVTGLRLANRWIALAGGGLSCALSLSIWVIVGGANGLVDLWLALAQCLLLAVGGYLAASLPLRRDSHGLFGSLGLLLPITLWAITFWALIRVALGHGSTNPMEVFALLLPIQSALLVLGAVIFEITDLLSGYLASRSTRPASGAGKRRR